MFLMSSGVSSTPRSDQQSQSLNDDVYQIDNNIIISRPSPLHGFNSDNEINSIGYLHTKNDQETSAEESNLTENVATNKGSSGNITTIVSTDQGNEELQYDTYDDLHEHTVALDSSNDDSVQLILLITKQINVDENRLDHLKSETFNTEQESVQNCTEENANLMLTKSSNERFLQGAYACSSILKSHESSPGNDNSVIHVGQNISNSDIDDSCDEHIYEEIDAERMSSWNKSKMKQPIDLLNKSGHAVRRSEVIHTVDDTINTRYPDGEDEHGYLRPKDLVASCEDNADCTDKNECVTISNLYDCPKNIDEDIREIKNNEFVALSFANNMTNNNKLSPSNSNQTSSGFDLNCPGNNLFPVCPESQNYPAIYESVDQVSYCPIYVNTNDDEFRTDTTGIHCSPSLNDT